jgi:hypothetical protein
VDLLLSILAFILALAANSRIGKLESKYQKLLADQPASPPALN